MHQTTMRLLAAVLTLGLLSVAAADPRGHGGGGGHRMSAEQAAEQARKHYGGRVLDVRPLRSNEGGYRVKLLDRGEVRSVTIPDAPGEGRGRARSGR